MTPRLGARSFGTVIFAAFFLTAIAAAPQTATTRSGSSEGPAASGSPASQKRYYYYETPRSSLDVIVHNVPPSDAARLSILQNLFSQANCTGDRLRTQPVEDKHDPGAQNLICTWPASSQSSIVVVAHYRHQGKGASALDDWSGAALLPALCLALQAQDRHNHWIFLESAGSRGDAKLLKVLSPLVIRHIRAVVAIDAIGLDSTLRFFTPSDPIDFSPADVHLQIELLAASLIDHRVSTPSLVSPKPWLAVDDTRPFRDHNIADILLHSVPPDKSRWPGSEKDLPSAIDGNAYYNNYRAIVTFLVALDSDASRLNTPGNPCWGAQPDAQLKLNDLPCIR
ncbi:MAG TPA: M28 family peptidase [Acidobacteriaceae bacterium]|jgi:hypothetical protein